VMLSAVFCISCCHFLQQPASPVSWAMMVYFFDW
jgi:hypothetical protein